MLLIIFLKASRIGYDEIISIIGHGGDASKSNSIVDSLIIKLRECTSLHTAGAMGLPSVLKDLTDDSTNVEARDKQLRTQLHYDLTCTYMRIPVPHGVACN